MWDILFLLDISGSMADELKLRRRGWRPYVKIDAVRSSLLSLLRDSKTLEGCRIGIAGFHSDPDSGELIMELLQPIKPVAEVRRGIDELETKLVTVDVVGGTPIGEAILNALEILYEAKETDYRRPKKIVLITDEKSNIGVSPSEIADAELSRRAVVDVIGIGPEIDAKELQALSNATGGRFFYAESEEEVRSAVFSIPEETKAITEDLHAVINEAEALKREITNYAGIHGTDFQARLLRDRVRDVRSRISKALLELTIKRNRVISRVQESSKLIDEGRAGMKDYAEKVKAEVSELPALDEAITKLRQLLEEITA